MPRTASFVFTRPVPAGSLPDDYLASVRWATRDGTALAGRDYTAASGVLTFEPGDLYKIVSVTVADPLPQTPQRSFSIRLRDEVGCTVSRRTATCVIPSTYPPDVDPPDVPPPAEADAGLLSLIGVPEPGYVPTNAPPPGIGVPV